MKRILVVIVLTLSLLLMPSAFNLSNVSADDSASDNTSYEFEDFTLEVEVVPTPEPPPGGGGGLGDIFPPIISDISVSNVGETDADIYWETNEKSTSQVEYWSSPSILTPIDKTYTREHLVRLTDLETGTTYFYKTISRDRSDNKRISEEQTFTTLEEEVVIEPKPTPPEPVEPVIEEPEPEWVIAPAPAPPVYPEPVSPAPEEPEGINWLLVWILIAVVILAIAGYWIYRRRKEGH